MLSKSRVKKTTKNYAMTLIPVKNREEFLVGQIIDKKTTLAAGKGYILIL